MESETAETENIANVDHGLLPAWKSADLPEPLPFTFGNVIRTIGPGAILLAGSIGGGEWIVGPMIAVKYGTGILWIATIGILLQMMFNLEAVRYTLYTGEPVLTGIMRLAPGPKVWGVMYILVGIAQLAVPALALGCANVIFSAANDDVPQAEDATTLLWIAYAIMAATVVLLLSGKSIERVLERLSWAMVVLIFGFLIVVNVLFVPIDQWMETASGFVEPVIRFVSEFVQHPISVSSSILAGISGYIAGMPIGSDDYDVMLLALFAATAGSGGLGNIAISNWMRDKGFGMAKHSGGFGGVLATDHVDLAPTGYVFEPTDENLSRWKTWWKYTLADQSGLWAIGCAVGMYLNVNLALQIIPSGQELTGTEAGAFQARFMAQQLWSGFWVLCLLNGFWVLTSTHIGNTDCLTRTVSDICWAGWPNLRTMSASRLYAIVLGAVIVWGVIALAIGDDAVSLFKVLGALCSPILAIAAVQILRVNTRFLPKQVRPPMWRRIGLLGCAVFYGGVSIMLAVDLLSKK